VLCVDQAVAGAEAAVMRERRVVAGAEVAVLPERRVVAGAEVAVMRAAVVVAAVGRLLVAHLAQHVRDSGAVA